MLDAVQHYAELASYGGCYALSIMKGSEYFYGNEIFDALRIFKDGCDHNFIKSGLENKSEAGFMNDPAGFFSYITGRKCSVRKAPVETALLPNEFAIGRYEISPDKAHFVLLDGGALIWDPWGESATVKYGKLVSLRIFTVEGGNHA